MDIWQRSLDHERFVGVDTGNPLALLSHEFHELLGFMPLDDARGFGIIEVSLRYIPFSQLTRDIERRLIKRKLKTGKEPYEASQESNRRCRRSKFFLEPSSEGLQEVLSIFYTLAHQDVDVDKPKDLFKVMASHPSLIVKEHSSHREVVRLFCARLKKGMS